MGKETGVLSTSANQADGVPLWKQEVNRRLAEHKSRKGLSAEPEALAEDQRGAGSRAAEIAARVAARYAKAPRYSEMLAGEARAAVRAAEAASLAAQEAQAAAEAVLAGLEAAPGAEPASAREKHGQGGFEVIEDGREAGEPALDGQDASGGVIGIQIVEAAQPMHAHLIEFPRALVAERKVRPQRAGGPRAAAGERQLSIFEVETGGHPDPIRGGGVRLVTKLRKDKL